MFIKLYSGLGHGRMEYLTLNNWIQTQQGRCQRWSAQSNQQFECEDRIKVGGVWNICLNMWCILLIDVYKTYFGLGHSRMENLTIINWIQTQQGRCQGWWWAEKNLTGGELLISFYIHIISCIHLHDWQIIYIIKWWRQLNEKFDNFYLNLDTTR